jgi:hypothetical protein
MNWSSATSLRVGIAGLTAFVAWQIGSIVSPAWAQAPAPPPPAPAEAPAAPAAPTSPLTSPSLAGPLTANPNPFKADIPVFDTIYATGVVSGLAFWQSSPVAGDRDGHFDLSNGQAILQKIDGPFQFYVQAGDYSLPSLGTIYVRASNALSTFFGPVPVGYAKLVPNDVFSIQAGSLPTLIGAEYTFTFQNMNIERGLLWNQEPAISKGVQVNLTTGPVAWSASFNDGFYSSDFDWITGSATWTIDPANTLVFVGGGSVSRSNVNTFASPFFLNNEDIFNIIYTYNAAPWTITPYFQYTNVPRNVALGALRGAESYGGALLVNYSIDSNWNLSGRAEIIGTTGSVSRGAANILYGPGSSAFSFTLTPTYQQGIFFVRGEGSIVDAWGTSAGSVFGRNGNTKTQGRLLIEGGVLF